jgi:hypothetical protein
MAGEEGMKISRISPIIPVSSFVNSYFDIGVVLLK